MAAASSADWSAVGSREPNQDHDYGRHSTQCARQSSASEGGANRCRRQCDRGSACPGWPAHHAALGRVVRRGGGPAAKLAQCRIRGLRSAVALVRHQDVLAAGFTGGAAEGDALAWASGAKEFLAELGSNAINIVLAMWTWAQRSPRSRPRASSRMGSSASPSNMSWYSRRRGGLLPRLVVRGREVGRIVPGVRPQPASGAVGYGLWWNQVAAAQLHRVHAEFPRHRVYQPFDGKPEC